MWSFYLIKIYEATAKRDPNSYSATKYKVIYYMNNTVSVVIILMNVGCSVYYYYFATSLHYDILENDHDYDETIAYEFRLDGFMLLIVGAGFLLCGILII